MQPYGERTRAHTRDTLTFSGQTQKITGHLSDLQENFWILNCKLLFGQCDNTAPSIHQPGDMEDNRCSSVSKGASLSIWLGCIFGASLWKFSGHAQLGGDPGVDPEPCGAIIYFVWRGNASGSPQEGLERVAGVNNI